METRVVGTDRPAGAQQRDVGETDAQLEARQAGVLGERGLDELVVAPAILAGQGEDVRGWTPLVRQTDPQPVLRVQREPLVAGQGQS